MDIDLALRSLKQVAPFDVAERELLLAIIGELRKRISDLEDRVDRHEEVINDLSGARV